MCEFEGNTVLSMENHILDKHFTIDENNKFPCDECTSKFDTREKLGDHLRKEYKDNVGDKEDTSTITIDTDTDENESKEEARRLKGELNALKKNFERLEALFQDSLEEVNQVRSEYEGKLIEANENYRAVKAENVELKERVDILFKLGRSYINRRENYEIQSTKNKENEVPASTEEDIETVDIEEITEEDLNAWTQNKFRGFRRVGPAKSAERYTNTNSKSRLPAATKTTSRAASGPSGTTSATSPPPPSTSSGTNSPPTASPPDPLTQTITSDSEGPMKRRPGRVLYCHYFSNTGRCPYEERTGATCRFEHKDAPMCSKGMSCNRAKCMFKHPNLAGQSPQSPHFLDRHSGPIHQINPWQLMSLWWIQGPNPGQFHLPNPWNLNRQNM